MLTYLLLTVAAGFPRQRNLSSITALLILWGAIPAQSQEPATPVKEKEPYFASNDQIFALLKMKHVRKELDLVDTQEEKIDEIITGMTKAWSEFNSAVEKELKEFRAKSKPRESREESLAWNKEYRELQSTVKQKQMEIYHALSAVARKKCEEILIPQQRDRLKQLALQRRFKNKGEQLELFLAANADAVPIILSAEQVGKISDIRTKVDAEFQKKMRDYQKQAAKQLKEETEAVLTPEQKEIWDRQMGKPFDLSPMPTSPTAEDETTEPSP